MTGLLWAALVAAWLSLRRCGVRGECANACSGHGICGAYDMCTCFRNWMAADCSQRICQFGLAHVDTPKGDLDASGGRLSGADTIVVRNDLLFPHGTTEAYPSVTTVAGEVLTNTAHEYRECSNKGYCDRSTGTCQCFEGYEGSACQRVACPSATDAVCSGHGQCLTAAEWAEHEQRNIYALWDADVSQTCLCDAGYTGVACERRRCPQGVDPLYPRDRGMRYSNWSVVIASRSAAPLLGNFSLVFYDADGEDWETESLPFNASCAAVTRALEALPQRVIPPQSVRCLHWPDFHGIAAADEPLRRAAESWPFFGVKYQLAFPRNAGRLAPLRVQRFRDGARATLSAADGARVETFVYANGFSGESADAFPVLCADVDFSFARHISANRSYDYLHGLTALETRLLARCLGDADGDDRRASAVDAVYGQAFAWDYGDAQQPHVVRMVARDPSRWRTDMCDGDADSVRGRADLCAFPAADETSAPPAFFAALFFDPDVARFVLLSPVSQDFDIYTQFRAFATRGVALRVSDAVSIATAADAAYADYVFSANNSQAFAGFTGDIACDNVAIGQFDLAACLRRGDMVFVLDASQSSRSLRVNPPYINLFQVTRLERRGARHVIALDAPVNFAYDADRDAARIYLFRPHRRRDDDADWPPSAVYDDADDAQAPQLAVYNYVSRCANRGEEPDGRGDLCGFALEASKLSRNYAVHASCVRSLVGLCDEEQGLCACFAGFAGAACDRLTEAIR